jgi:hypothetical protein
LLSTSPEEGTSDRQNNRGKAVAPEPSADKVAAWAEKGGRRTPCPDSPKATARQRPKQKNEGEQKKEEGSGKEKKGRKRVGERNRKEKDRRAEYQKDNMPTKEVVEQLGDWVLEAKLVIPVR